MIRYLIHRPTTDGKVYAVIAGLSTDAKPTAGLITGSRFVEADTGAGYLFNETGSAWTESQQLTEAVAAYLDEHPEALDQAAIEAMFSDQLDGIEEDVGGLKSALTLEFVNADNYEFGKIDFANTGWTYSASTSRIRIKQGTSIRLYAGDTIGIVANSGVVFSIAWLNDNGIYNLASGWLTTFTCPVTANYVLVARYATESAIANVSDVANNIIINSSVVVKTLKQANENIATINDKLKTINNLVGIYNPISSDFDIGNISISASGWTYSERDSRVRTKNGTTISLKQGDIISLTDYTDARMYIGYLKNDGTYGVNGWLTEDYVCPADGDYVLLLCHSSDRRLNSVEELLSLLLIFTKNISNGEDESDTIPLKYDGIKKNLFWVGKTGTNKQLIAEYIDVSEYKCIKYAVPSGYEIAVSFYDENKVLFNDTGWDTTGIGYRLCGSAKYASLSMRKSDNTAINPSEVTSAFVFELFGHKMYSYSNGPVYTIYHRGCGNTAPENTAASFVYAAKERAKYVETDVRYTSDGVPVLLHDETINRTARNADGSTISETINIADITYAQAIEYDFGVWKGSNFAGQKILTFVEFVKLCAAYELHPIVELKGGVTTERAKTLYQTAISCGMKGRIAWIGDPGGGVLEALTEVDPAVDFYWLTSLTSANVTSAIGYKTSANRIHMDVYVTQSSTLDQQLLDQATEAGVEIAVWMANTEEQLEYLFGLRGVTGYTTDGNDVAVGLIAGN